MKTMITLICLMLAGSQAFAKLSVTATTTDIGALLDAVGNGRIDVLTIAKGTQDPHQVEAKPSFMMKMNRAALVVSQGLELESAWLQPLVDGARNPKIARGSKGFLELAGDLDPIEIPKGAISRADGDVHPGGNPHFQTDPIRLGKAAVLIADRLGELDPANKDFFSANARDLKARLEKKTEEWKKRLEKSGVREVVTYHKMLSYFFDRFGLKGSLQLEPKPGIPPTTSHLLDVIGQMKKRGVKLVMIENIYDDSVSEKLKASIPGVRVVRVPVMVLGEPDVKTNELLIEKIVTVIEGEK